MQLPPPSDFDGVSVRVFPLRAKLHALRSFCDGYVNIIPDEAGYFRPFVPYVYLLIVNYGRMAVKKDNLGWLSQHEIVFAIPVEWHRRQGDRYVFLDWGLVTPFIYVDNELSMTTGRMVYGWPKVMARFTPELSAWVDSPRAPMRMLSVSGGVFSDTTVRDRLDERVFLEIACSQAISGIEPLSLMQKTPALARDLAGALMEVGLLPEGPGGGLASWAARIRKLARRLDPLRLDMSINTFNLKQFRSADHAALACYQAVTNTTMDVWRLNDAGLLGRGALVGDPSAGFRIDLHRYRTYPIVETLGLEIDRQWRGDGVEVAQLKPVYPFWVDIDVRYNLGHTLAWRTRKSGWTGLGGKRFPAYEKAGEDTRHYNSVSGSTREISGPFEMPNTTLRVLPLLADREKLQKCCDDYLNRPLLGRDHDTQALKPDERFFDVWGEYVYLVLGNHKQMASETNNIGWWADRDVTFYVPVKWYEWSAKGKRGRLRSLALVPVFSYANSVTAAITGSEVSGIPMLKATIDSPPTAWMDESGPSEATDHRYLRMTSRTFQALGEGVEAQDQVVLEVWSGLLHPYNDDVAWRQIAERWGDKLTAALMRKAQASANPNFQAARALALEVLANDKPINVVTLKQFRDVSDPRDACYQALNLIQRTIDTIYDIREIEKRLYVSIYSYESQPIIETLGLVAATTRREGSVIEHVLQPVRPFWMKVGMREEKGIMIMYRAGETTWSTNTEEPKDYFFQSASPGLQVGNDLMDECRINPQYLREVVKKFKTDKGTVPLTQLEIEKAVDSIEPQMIIEPALSQEWGNLGNPRWYQAVSGLSPSLRQEAQALQAAKRHLKNAEQQGLPKEQVLALQQDVRSRLLGLHRASQKPDFCIPYWNLQTQNAWQFVGINFAFGCDNEDTQYGWFAPPPNKVDPE